MSQGFGYLKGPTSASTLATNPFWESWDDLVPKGSWEDDFRLPCQMMASFRQAGDLSSKARGKQGKEDARTRTLPHRRMCVNASECDCD